MFRVIAGLWLLFCVPIFLLMCSNLLGTIGTALLNDDGRPQTVRLSDFSLADAKGAHQEFQVRGWYTGIEGTVVTDRSKGWKRSYLVISADPNGITGPHVVFVFHDEDLDTLRDKYGPSGAQVVASGFVDAWVSHEKEVRRDLSRNGIDL